LHCKFLRFFNLNIDHGIFYIENTQVLTEEDVPSTQPILETHSKVVDDEKMIDCVCGLSGGSDVAIVQCERCSLWSHVVCNGFYHANDPRIVSARFLCHQCDPRGTTPNWVIDLRELALFRTCISISWMEASPTGEVNEDLLVKFMRELDSFQL
jgi:hypothetical protein